MMPSDIQSTIARLVTCFETLTPHNAAELLRFYDANARFKDPFNEVQGVTAIQRIYAHMFVALEAPRFVVTGQVVEGAQCFLTWEFHFRFKNSSRAEQETIRGGSHLLFSGEGLILVHRDYWDAAEELYEKLPVLGGLMRWLKKRANR